MYQEQLQDDQVLQFQTLNLTERLYLSMLFAREIGKLSESLPRTFELLTQEIDDESIAQAFCTIEDVFYIDHRREIENVWQFLSELADFYDQYRNIIDQCRQLFVRNNLAITKKNINSFILNCHTNIDYLGDNLNNLLNDFLKSAEFGAYDVSNKEDLTIYSDNEEITIGMSSGEDLTLYYDNDKIAIDSQYITHAYTGRVEGPYPTNEDEGMSEASDSIEEDQGMSEASDSIEEDGEDSDTWSVKTDELELGECTPSLPLDNPRIQHFLSALKNIFCQH